METLGLSRNGLPILLMAAPFLIGLVGGLFKWFQNKKELVGGIISTPKSLWLSYTVISWFLIPFFFLSLDINPALLIFVKLHLLSFWLRGIVELVMIYKLFNWSPLYGISHSGAHALALLTGLFYLLTTLPSPFALHDQVVLAFMISVFISVSFEVVFAVFFLKIRKEGNYFEEHKIYFASDEPQWQKVNNLTKLALVFGIGGYAISVGLLFI